MPLVYAGVCSHAPGITGRADQADPTVRQQFYDAFDQMRADIEATEPDALIVIAGVSPILPDGSAAGLTHEFAAGVTLILDSQVVRNSAAGTPPPDPARVLSRRDAQHADVRVVMLQDQVLSAGASRRHVEKVTWP